MSLTEIYKTLTSEEATLYTKCKHGKRSGTWDTSLVSVLEHHGEQNTFKTLLEKLRNAAPIKDHQGWASVSNRQVWIATQLNTSIQELAKFEKKYPMYQYQPYQTPEFQFDRIASLEKRVAYLEHELNRLYQFELERVRELHDQVSRKRNPSRPHSPDSPFHSSTPYYQESNFRL